MNAQELLIHLTDGAVDRLFETARKVPADKLDWQPAPGARSALNQLQEVATALQAFWGSIENRKLEWDQETMGKWMEERSKITSIDELERVCKEQTKRLTDYIRTTTEDQFTEPVELPFPRPFILADVLSYQYWNASYHDAQINYILAILGVGE